MRTQTLPASHARLKAMASQIVDAADEPDADEELFRERCRSTSKLTSVDRARLQDILNAMPDKEVT